MNTKKHILSLKVSVMAICAFLMTSCLSDDTGEFKLTGNIEKYIPKESCYLSHYIDTQNNGTRYFILTPKLDEKFEYWGLHMLKVDYYTNGTFFKTVNEHPHELTCKVADLGIGRHEILAKITIKGEECNDLVLDKTYDFTISQQGKVSLIQGDFYIDYNQVTSGGILHITPQVLTERSSKNCQIKKVIYYWDEESIATKTSSPFTLDYQVNEAADTEHSLRIAIYYSDANGDRIYNWAFSKFKVLKDDDCFNWWTIKSKREDYKIGETLQIVGNVFMGHLHKDSYSLTVYLDGEEIGKSHEFPYELNYTIKSMPTGTHKITGKWTVSQSDGTQYSYSYDKDIVVTP